MAKNSPTSNTAVYVLIGLAILLVVSAILVIGLNTIRGEDHNDQDSTEQIEEKQSENVLVEEVVSEETDSLNPLETEDVDTPTGPIVPTIELPNNNQ